MEIQPTYRQHIKQRIDELLGQVEKIHDIVANQLIELSCVECPYEKSAMLDEMKKYLNKADYIHFEIYMLDEVRTLLCK